MSYAAMNENDNTIDEMLDYVGAESGAGAHWVESLFPPTFRLLLKEPVDGRVATAVLDRRRCDDLLAESDETGAGNGELFAKLARGISPLDVAAIKNVYHRVWLMLQDASTTASKLLHHYVRCLEVKREDNQNYSVLCCVRQLCTMISTLR